MASAETIWMTRAFTNLKAALMSEIISVSGEYVSEDYIRSSLLRGLMIANPTSAGSVCSECPTPWGGNVCHWGCGNAPGGRPPAHDIGIRSDDDGLRAVCEVKWIVSNRAADLRKDIWKLALTRGVALPAQATKTYLAIAGHREHVSATLDSLRGTDLDLRWATQGRGGSVPRPRQLPIARALRAHLSVRNELARVLCWGANHLRRPPDTWEALRLSVRDRWWQTEGDRKWVAILWELDTWGGTRNTPQINWQDLTRHLTQCQP